MLFLCRHLNRIKRYGTIKTDDSLLFEYNCTHGDNYSIALYVGGSVIDSTMGYTFYDFKNMFGDLGRLFEVNDVIN